MHIFGGYLLQACLKNTVLLWLSSKLAVCMNRHAERLQQVCTALVSSMLVYQRAKPPVIKVTFGCNLVHCHNVHKLRVFMSGGCEGTQSLYLCRVWNRSKHVSGMKGWMVRARFAEVGGCVSWSYHYRLCSYLCSSRWSFLSRRIGHVSYWLWILPAGKRRVSSTICVFLAGNTVLVATVHPIHAVIVVIHTLWLEHLLGVVQCWYLNHFGWAGWGKHN